LEAGPVQLPASSEIIAEKPTEQPFGENKNGSHFGCLASY
jgi:hypothetical protein